MVSADMMKRDVDTDKDEAEVATDAPSPERGAVSAKRVAVSIGLIAVLLALGSSAAYVLHMTRPKPEKTDIRALPPLVEVIKLQPRDTTEQFRGYGSARADREALIAAEVHGTVVMIPPDVKDGADVEAGSVLVQVDARQYERQLQRARGQLQDVSAQITQLETEEGNVQKLIAIARQDVKVNEDEYKRLTDLFEREVASKKEWDFARLALQQASRDLQGLENSLALIPSRRLSLLAARESRMAEVELATLDVERCTIRAPFDGRIQECVVEVGDFVTNGSPVARIIDPQHIEIPIELPLGVRPRVEVGAMCRLTIDSMPGAEWRLPLTRIAPMADPQSRTFTVFIDVDNAEQERPLVPGYFLTARVTGPVIHDALVIPRGAIIDSRVYVAREKSAELRSIKIETLIGDEAVISGDVARGDRVILTNLDRLHDGCAIRVEAGPSDEETVTDTSGGDA